MLTTLMVHRTRGFLTVGESFAFLATGFSCNPAIFEGFNQDGLGKLIAEGEAGIANEANHIGVTGQELDDGVFTETDFAQAVGELGRGAQLPDAHFHAGTDAVERTKRIAAGR
jgi:hypothetical protein